MSLTIELTPEQEAVLQAQARAAGVDSVEYARQLLAADLAGGTVRTYPDEMPTGATAIGEGALLEEYQGTIYIRGTRMKVRLIAQEARQGSTAENIQEAHPHLSLAQIHAALAYYYAHQAEMDADIERRMQQAETWRAQSTQPTRQELEELRSQVYYLSGKF